MPRLLGFVNSKTAVADAPGARPPPERLILAKGLLDPSANAAAKVRAANSILSNASKSIELEDLAVRIADLERAAEQSKEKGY
jgi:hypothetical protein